jgi:hypothetical protein
VRNSTFTYKGPPCDRHKAGRWRVGRPLRPRRLG